MTRLRVYERLLGAYLLIILHVQGKYVLVEISLCFSSVSETCILVVGVGFFWIGVFLFFCGQVACLPHMPYRHFPKKKDITVVICCCSIDYRLGLF